MMTEKFLVLLRADELLDGVPYRCDFIVEITEGGEIFLERTIVPLEAGFE